MDGAEEIARRSRGTPRIANRLLRRVRDYAQVEGDGVITRDMADEALKIEGIDGAGRLIVALPGGGRCALQAGEVHPLEVSQG